MSKKNKNFAPKVQTQSPKSYLTSGKARKLPLYECRVNLDWRESGLATVIVARSHAGGSITWASYLIDVFCLGLKQTSFEFNDELDGYQEMVEQLSKVQELEVVDYALVHNIVYGGIAYADDLGMKPLDKDWAVSQYVLEEDNDDVELIELEFGKEGQPFYCSGPYDNVPQILQKLNASVGEGNYLFMSHLEDDEDWDDDDDWEEDDEESDDDDEEFTDFEEIKEDKKIVNS